MRRVLPALLVFISACTPTQSLSVAPSSAAAASQEPSVKPSPTGTPEPDMQPTWVIQAPTRDVEFLSDGTAYIALWAPGESSSSLEAIRTDGSTPPGWPIRLEGVVNGMAVDASGVLIAIVCDYGPDAAACELHRLQPNGKEQSGWPVSLPHGCFEPLLAPDGVVVTTCDGAAESLLVAIGTNGHVLDGWPVALTSAQSSGLTADGSVYALTQSAEQGTKVHLLAADGRPIAGWPVQLPTAASDRFGSVGVRPRADGSLVVWWMEGAPSDQICLEADRTLITVIGQDGQQISGMPVALAGFGSSPAVAEDGRLWMRMDGPQSGIVGLGSDGEPLAGWPVALPPDECAGADGSAEVRLLPDDRLIVIQDGVIYAFDTDGNALDGWPFDTQGVPANGCVPSICTPGTNGVVPPAVDEDGTAYLVVFPAGEPTSGAASLVALDRSGESLPGWPRDLRTLDCNPDECPFEMPQVFGMRVSPYGHVYVIAREGLIRIR